MIKKIETSPQTYPFINKYRYWPGPNSNTFAQWVVRDKTTLGLRAIGRNFSITKRITSQQKLDAALLTPNSSASVTIGIT